MPASCGRAAQAPDKRQRDDSGYQIQRIETAYAARHARAKYGDRRYVGKPHQRRQREANQHGDAHARCGERGQDWQLRRHADEHLAGEHPRTLRQRKRQQYADAMRRATQGRPACRATAPARVRAMCPVRAAAIPRWSCAVHSVATASAIATPDSNAESRAVRRRNAPARSNALRMRSCVCSGVMSSPPCGNAVDCAHAASSAPQQVRRPAAGVCRARLPTPSRPACSASPRFISARGAIATSSPPSGSCTSSPAMRRSRPPSLHGVANVPIQCDQRAVIEQARYRPPDHGRRSAARCASPTSKVPRKG